MRALVAEAVDAGAVGLSTSRTLLHRDLEGTVIPGTYADRRELTELMARAGPLRHCPLAAGS